MNKPDKTKEDQTKMKNIIDEVDDCMNAAQSNAAAAAGVAAQHAVSILKHNLESQMEIKSDKYYKELAN